MSPSPARIRSTIAAVVDQPDELRELRIFHKALADVNRLRIVQRLASSDATVTELTRTLASNALRALATVKRFMAVAAYGAQPANADIAAELIGAALAELRR